MSLLSSPHSLSGGAGSSSSAPAPALSPEEEQQLAATKSVLFGTRSNQHQTTTTADRQTTKETEEEASARIALESHRALLSLSHELGSVDGLGVLGNPSSLLDGAGLPSSMDGLDLTTSDIDFDEVDVDLEKFQQDELVKEALEKGVDLRNYSRQIEGELAVYEQKCVSDYIADADELAALHTQLKSCDSILQSMESMLSTFQHDLVGISAEIEGLQSKSSQMNIKLTNYTQAEHALHDFIDQTYIPDDLAHIILEGDINEAWVAALVELDRKLLFLARQQATNPVGAAAVSIREMAPIADKLKLKAVARIRAFLLERFHALKKPKTNIQIQQKYLLKFAYFYQFLLNHADDKHNAGSAGGSGNLSHSGSYSNLHASTPTSASTPSSAASSLSASAGVDICGEIRREYHETISAIYYSKFKKYLSEMKKLQADNEMDKGDTLASEEGSGGKGAAGGGMLSGFFGSKKSSAAIDHMFRLTGREEVLVNTSALSSHTQSIGGDGVGAAGDHDLIIPHLVGAAGTKLPFERIFKSAQTLLMDTATSEYDFLVEFFGERMDRESDRAGVHEEAIQKEKEGAVGEKETATPAERGREHLSPHSRDKHLFALVFNKTIQLFLSHLESYLHTCHDSLSLLLLIRIICQHNLVMQYRRVHALDHLFDRINMLLWPRFKAIFDANVEAVMKVTHCEVRPGTEKHRPHYIGVRYAEFAAAILRLNQGYNDDILVANLKRLRGVVDKFFLRSAGRCASPKTQVIFLLNNYHSILHILCIQHPHGESEDAAYWTQQAQAQIGLYVEEELQVKPFGKLIDFVKRVESVDRQAQHGHAPADAAQKAIDLRDLKSIVDEFAREWKNGIATMKSHVESHFAQETDKEAYAGGSHMQQLASAATGSLHTTGPAALPSSSSSGLRSGASSSSLPSSSVQIFMHLLSQLVMYYKRFQLLLEKHVKDRQITQSLVSIQTILIEIQRLVR